MYIYMYTHTRADTYLAALKVCSFGDVATGLEDSGSLDCRQTWQNDDIFSLAPLSLTTVWMADFTRTLLRIASLATRKEKDECVILYQLEVCKIRDALGRKTEVRSVRATRVRRCLRGG